MYLIFWTLFVFHNLMPLIGFFGLCLSSIYLTHFIMEPQTRSFSVQRGHSLSICDVQ